MIYRKAFNPTSGHYVSSEHFVGETKTYENNIPTIVPKAFKERMFKSSLGLIQKRSKSKEESFLMFPENESEGEILEMKSETEVNHMKSKSYEKDLEFHEKKN